MAVEPLLTVLGRKEKVGNPSGFQVPLTYNAPEPAKQAPAAPCWNPKDSHGLVAPLKETRLLFGNHGCLN